jgi:hypothetical protein
MVSEAVKWCLESRIPTMAANKPLELVSSSDRVRDKHADALILHYKRCPLADIRSTARAARIVVRAMTTQVIVVDDGIGNLLSRGRDGFVRGRCTCM